MRPGIARELAGSQLQYVFPWGMAGVGGDPEDDDHQRQGERRNADRGHPPVVLVPVADDDFFQLRRRIAADLRHAHLGRRQVDGLLSGRERTGHGVAG